MLSNIRRRLTLATVLTVLLSLALILQLLPTLTAAPTARASTFPQWPAVNVYGFPGWGVPIASVDSVSVYSNGGDTNNARVPMDTYGYKYQCVELIQRFFATKWLYKNTWNITVAAQMMDNPPSTDNSGNQLPKIDQYWNDGTAVQAPMRGDALVFANGTPYGTYHPGHVALVTGTVNGRVYFVEQNWTPFGQDSLPISLSNGHYVMSTTGAEVADRSGYTIRGWLHSEANTLSSSPASTIVNFEIKEPVIGVGTGQHAPQSPTTRSFQMRLTDSKGNKVERSGNGTWNAKTGYWVGSVNFGTNLAPGPRIVEVRMAQSRYNPYKITNPVGIPSPTNWKLINQYEIEKDRIYLPQPSKAVTEIDPTGKQVQFPSQDWVRVISGDINNDKTIDILDYNILLNCMQNNGCSPGSAQYIASDIDESGVVDGVDYNLWLRQNQCFNDNTKCYDK